MHRFSPSLLSVDQSNRPSITPQPNSREDKCGGECQSDPKVRRAQISSWRQLCQRMNVRVMLALEIKGFRRESGQAVPQHSDKMRCVEGNRFENSDREQRYYRPKKGRAPRPARNQEKPAINRRMPERQRDQAVKQNQRLLE